jgi:hypothetical protein
MFEKAVVLAVIPASFGAAYVLQMILLKVVLWAMTIERRS